MQAPQELTEKDVYAMTPLEAYSMFSTYIDPWGSEEEKTLYQDVRFGINGIEFDFYDWAQGRMVIKTKRGIVKYRGMALKEEYLNTEIERRDRMMKKHIIKERFEKPTWLKPRGIENVGKR